MNRPPTGEYVGHAMLSPEPRPLPGVALPPSGTAPVWHCPRLALPPSGTAPVWHCPRLEPNGESAYPRPIERQIRETEHDHTCAMRHAVCR
jgi:hypothetical protein